MGNQNNNNNKSLESWIWDAACAIRGVQDAPKYKDFILPLIFVKRLCDVFDDEVQRITDKIGKKEKALKLIEKDRKLIRFYIPLRPDNLDDPTWSVIRKLSSKIGEELTNKSELYFEVELNTVETGNGKRDRDMRDDYLQTDLFLQNSFYLLVRNMNQYQVSLLYFCLTFFLQIPNASLLSFFLP